MKLPRISSLLVAGFSLLAGGWPAPGSLAAEALPPAATGANVDESKVQVTFYVDAANGEAADDDKHGAAEAPFATLGYACRTAEQAKDAGKGVKVIVAAGTYREAVVIHPPANGRPDTDAPLIIEAAERDQTAIDGADAEGWTPSTWKEEGGRWSHPWPFVPVATKPTPAQIATTGKLPPPALAAAYRHGDLVLVDGVALRQVNGPADLQPGTYWIKAAAPSAAPRRGAVPPASAAPGGSVVEVQPPEDAVLATSIIQVGTKLCGLQISGRQNVVVRGLMFQHAAAPLYPVAGSSGAAGLLLDGCANVLVEDVLSQWNDGVGLGVLGGASPSANITLRRVRLLHNGGAGLSLNGVQNFLAEDCEASFNNFRGEWTRWVDPQRLAGVKAVRVDGSTWRRQRAVGNSCRGVWFAGATNLTVEEAVVRDNFVSGFLIDGSRGPTLVRRSLIAGTKTPPGVDEDAALPAAVSVYTSPDVTLEGNVIAANAVPALGLSDVPPGIVEAAARPGGAAALRDERHTYRHNVVYGQEGGQVLCDWPSMDRTEKINFAFFYGTLSLEENCFWNPAAGDVFCVYDKTGYRHPGMNFDGWKAFLAGRAGGADKAPAASSRWQDPLFVSPGEGDFRLQEGSPLKEWNLLVDESSAGL